MPSIVQPWQLMHGKDERLLLRHRGNVAVETVDHDDPGAGGDLALDAETNSQGDRVVGPR